MNKDKYVGIDVHQASTVIAVLDAHGKCVVESILGTKADTISDSIRGLSGRIHATPEEGTQAHWLCGVLKPQVAGGGGL